MVYLNQINFEVKHLNNNNEDELNSYLKLINLPGYFKDFIENKDIAILFMENHRRNNEGSNDYFNNIESNLNGYLNQIKVLNNEINKLEGLTGPVVRIREYFVQKNFTFNLTRTTAKISIVYNNKTTEVENVDIVFQVIGKQEFLKDPLIDKYNLYGEPIGYLSGGEKYSLKIENAINGINGFTSQIKSGDANISVTNINGINTISGTDDGTVQIYLELKGKTYQYSFKKYSDDGFLFTKNGNYLSVTTLPTKTYTTTITAGPRLLSNFKKKLEKLPKTL